MRGIKEQAMYMNYYALGAKFFFAHNIIKFCRTILLFFLWSGIMLTPSLVAADGAWVLLRGSAAHRMRHLSCEAGREGRCLMSADQSIYQWNPQEELIHLVTSSLAQAGTIHAMVETSNVIYAATDQGLYQADLEGRHWQRIYGNSDVAWRQCRSLLVANDHLYVGTGKGLMRQLSDGSWQRIVGDWGQVAIDHLTMDGTYIYLASEAGVFRLSNQNDVSENIFFAISLNERVLSEQGMGMPVNEGAIRGLYVVQRPTQQIHLDAKNPWAKRGTHPYLFVLSQEGVFGSYDQGQSWQAWPVTSLPLEESSALVVLETGLVPMMSDEQCQDDVKSCFTIFVASHQGVYGYHQERWMRFTQGLPTFEVEDLSVVVGPRLVAATAQGVYVWGQVLERLKHLDGGGIDKNDWDAIQKKVERLIQQEPRIQQVQQWAIEYAEVSPDKIQQWRKFARVKALMPTVSVGVDRLGGDFYHWNTGASPDELQKGKFYTEWDMSVVWDLADLVWSTDQTTIDSRSKLMVELRESILDQVTRLYFERRREQWVLLTLPHEIESFTRMDHQMRIDELTALIDVLTGQRFSAVLLDQ